MIENKKIKVILNVDDSPPVCDHGPMLLFEPDSKTDKRFFACSAYRDRKLCPTYFLEKDWLRAREHHMNITPTSNLKFKSDELETVRIETLPKVQQTAENERKFCRTCGVVFLDTNHKGHEILNGFSDSMLQLPSLLLNPLDHAKKEAQYLFTQTSIDVIITNLEESSATDVLCIASPSIYQHIMKSGKGFKSLMLDLDVRFRQFYSVEEYLVYNMFNHYFFDGPNAIEVFKEFLHNSKNGLAIVIDPPFGGKMEILSQTINKINEEFQALCINGNKRITIFLISPYFMEPQIVNSFPGIQMMDYKVEYKNHDKFQQGKKQGSIVRIFTNADLSLLTLPSSEGYKYCSKCQKWTSPENRHCATCNSCTSKDGRTYVHCKKCQRCVKPTWTHCSKCNRCGLSDHPCDKFIENNKKRKIDPPKKGRKKIKCTANVAA